MSPRFRAWIIGLLIAACTAVVAYVTGGCFIGDLWPGIAKPGTNQAQTVTIQQGQHGVPNSASSKPDF